MITRRSLMKVISGLAAGIFIAPLTTKAVSKTEDHIVYHCGSSRMLLDTKEILFDKVSLESNRYIKVTSWDVVNKSSENVVIAMLSEGKPKATFYLSKNGGKVDAELITPFFAKFKTLSFQVQTPGWEAKEGWGVGVSVSYQVREEMLK